MSIAMRRLRGWPNPGTVITNLGQLSEVELDAMPSYPPLKRLCMFDPVDTFQVESNHNPHMPEHIRKADPLKARDEWLFLKESLEESIPVTLITGDIVSPDMVFAANFGLMAPGNTAVISRMVHPERREERWTFLRWLISEGYTASWTDDDYNEGQGDVLRPPGKGLLISGHGFRSVLESHVWVGRHLGLVTVALRLVDPHFYHLDTCLCMLSHEHVLYYPGAFDRESVRMIEYLFPKRTIVTREEAMRFSCNSVAVGDRLFMPYCSVGLRARLEKNRIDVVVRPQPELMKSGGANACTVLQAF